MPVEFPECSDVWTAVGKTAGNSADSEQCGVECVTSRRRTMYELV